MIEKSKVAFFSGHRKLPLDITMLEVALEKSIADLIEQGVVFFGNGGALGFDTIAAEAVLRLKEDYSHIRLVMVLPCPPEQQSLKWNGEQKSRYYSILKRADKVRILSPRYTDGCMLARNRHMVDNSEYLICYLREDRGGTFYTVNYAEKRGLKIIRL